MPNSIVIRITKNCQEISLMDETVKALRYHKMNQELKDKVLMKEVHFGKMKKIIKEQLIRCLDFN